MTNLAAGLTDRELDALCASITGDANTQSPEAWASSARPELAAEFQALEQTAAALHLACLPAINTPPHGLMQRVHAGVLERIAEASEPESSATGDRPERFALEAPSPQQIGAAHGENAADSGVLRTLAITGWVAAAACVALAAFAWRGATADAMPNPAADRVAIVNAGHTPANLIDRDLAPIDAIAAQGRHPLSEGVTGDVVWDAQAQRGYIRLAGLQPNNPGEYQYQLWIFDKKWVKGDNPLAQNPTDGGVFDVQSRDESLVPIDAKLAVDQPIAFVITKERPGGVVVSDRSEIVALALAN